MRMSSRSCLRLGRVLLIAAVAALASSVWAAGDSPNCFRPRKPKNVILMISDGCGYNHIIATDYYQYGRVGRQVYERFPFQAGMSTFSYNGLVGNPPGYDPLLAWLTFGYHRVSPTDSASAATAMSTGVKNLDGVIGIDPAGNALRHAFQRAEEVGKSTGVITNVQWSHATPAGFVAHNSSRNNYDQIAREMIYDSATDVIMGAGHPFYNDNGERLSTPPFQYKYVGGEATWNDLVAGTAGDPDWTHIQTRQEFRRLMWGRAPKRVCGTAQVASTTQQSRRNNPGDPDNRDDAPYEVPLNETVPTLAEMTLGALNVLDCDNDGLCLMIEGGAVDWTGHANQKGRLIEEEIDFNHAVEAVMLWVLCHSNWDETLLIVTGDHETGYLWGRGSNPTWEPIVNNGRGVPPGMQFNSGDHTNQLIPIFAKGDASRLLAAKADQVDPERGRYIDNTEIAEVMFDVID